ncbi:hypothetical protein D3C75_953640 [compost metagenome]
MLQRNFVNGKSHRHKSACDRSCPRAAVRLDNVAVQRNAALAERLQINYRTKRAADQPLDLHRPSGQLAACRLALVACLGRPGKHRIFSGYPALALSFQKRRDLLVYRCGDDDLRVSHFNQN